MVAVVARHAEKSELFSAGERAHPTNERNKLENSVCALNKSITFWSFLGQSHGVEHLMHVRQKTEQSSEHHAHRLR